ncbi:MAG: B12-binding domain-containing radical SAM protein [Eubacterium sp.]|nr:B12-binding domain-containing radical SAM protein [Eubacterium sp.]
MKTLLAAINAKYIHSNPAVYLLRACADPEDRPNISIAEYTINQYPEEILADIYRRGPDLLAISCYIWNWKLVMDLLSDIGKVLPDCRIWLGGPEAAWNAEEILRKYPAVEGIFTGEGENSFRKLVRCLNRQEANRVGAKKSESLPIQKPEISRVPGIAFRRPDPKEDGGLVRTPEEPVADLDTLPFLYNDENLEQFRNKIIYYESSRGCPFVCGYCLSSQEHGIRLRSLPLVEKELQFFLDHKVPQVKFLDRTFNCNRAHAMGIWTYLKEHDNGITNFHFELEADLLTEEELELLTSLRPGQVQVEIGVQSTNGQTLAAVGRHTSFEHLKKCVMKLLNAGNMHVHLDLIAGLPYEDYPSFQKSFNEVYALHPNELQLGFLKVLHGTPLARQTEQYGIHYMTDPPYEVFSTDWISYDQILELKRVEEVLEIYYNSAQFSRTIRVLETYFPDAFNMYKKLADFYDRHHYFVQTPARAKRYKILLEFIEENVKAPSDTETGRMDMFRQLLTYDLYLRENAKSRPGFAPKRPAAIGRRHEFIHEEDLDWKIWEICPYGPGSPGNFIHCKTETPVRVCFHYQKRSPISGNVNISLEE